MLTNCFKLSNTEIAKKLNVSSQCVSQWIKGKREPSLDKLPKLAKALNCSIDEIVLALLDVKQNATKTKEI